ncbi:glycosyltransferase [Aquisalimonas sp. APHAB1-3]|uniref:glycosyltransferase n=1 Tax=Aquisalimonas sp. APHAB1-3 TaxID=3402080 RepID=UPI003AAA22CF
MKITILCPSFAAGGAEKVAVNLANDFAKRGHRVTFLVLKSSGPYDSDLDPEIKVVNLNTRARWGVLSLRRFLRKDDSEAYVGAKRDINILLCFSSIFLKKNIVLREANTLHAVARRSFFSRLGRFLLLKLAYGKSSAVICNSNGTANDLVSRRIVSRAKTHVIANPVLPGWRVLEEKVHDAIENDWLNSSDVHVFLAVGRLHPQKNHSLLLAAFQIVSQKLRSARMIIIGSGPLKSELSLEAEELGIENKIEFIPFVENPFPYYLACEAFVLTSRYEGFGNVLVEALSTGAKVVSTECDGGPPEILGYGEYGALVPVHDHYRIAEAMLDAVFETGAFKDFDSEKVISQSLKYTVENMSQKYLNVLSGFP